MKTSPTPQALSWAIRYPERIANALVIAALAFGAVSIAFAIFLILELGLPYTGLLKVSPAALQQAIEFVDK